MPAATRINAEVWANGSVDFLVAVPIFADKYSANDRLGKCGKLNRVTAATIAVKYCSIVPIGIEALIVDGD